MPPSTRHPEALGEIATLRRLTQALATLEAILCPEWQDRFYSFNSRWAAGEQMASMRDGSGDEWFLLFSPVGAAIKGLDHESVLAQQAAFAARIQQTVPPEFGPFLHEAALDMERASFCLWRRHAEDTRNVVSPGGGLPPGDGDGSPDYSSSSTATRRPAGGGGRGSTTSGRLPWPPCGRPMGTRPRVSIYSWNSTRT